MVLSRYLRISVVGSLFCLLSAPFGYFIDVIERSLTFLIALVAQKEEPYIPVDCADSRNTGFRFRALDPSLLNSLRHESGVARLAAARGI